MLYILLIIIAIGVLLASEAGKAFLSLLIKLALIAGGLYLCFWVVMFAVVFFTSESGKTFANGIGQFILFILAVIVVGPILNYLVEFKRNKEKRARLWRKIKESYIKNKSVYIGWGVILGIIILAVALPYLVDIYYRLIL